MAKRFFYVSLGVLALAGAFGSAEARTWHVLPDGSGDAPGIQPGLDSAAVGDTVELGCGTYVAVNIIMKAGITLRGETGDPACVTIDGQGMDRVFYCSMLSSETLFEGLTITGGRETAYPGYPNGRGGGMFCEGSSFKMRDCVFEENFAEGGGAVCCDNGSVPRFVRCRFTSNTGGACGGLLCTSYSSPVLEGCVFLGNASVQSGNFGGGMYIDTECHPSLTECLFVNNSAHWYGGAFYCGNYCTVSFEACTFYGNSATYANGGGAIYCRAFSRVTLDNCLLAYNTDGGALTCHLQSYEPALTCCDIFGNADGDWISCIADQYGVTGNFSADPLFCNADARDFTLRSDSPCLPGHHPDGANCGLIGALDEGCSAPAAVEHTSWGGVKRMFR